MEHTLEELRRLIEKWDQQILDNYEGVAANFRYSPPRDNPPPTCEQLLAIADEMGGRDMMRFAR